MNISYFFKIHFNTILSSTPKTPKWAVHSFYECSLLSRQSYHYLFDNTSSLTYGKEYWVLQHVTLRKINTGNDTHTHTHYDGSLAINLNKPVSRALRHVLDHGPARLTAAFVGFSLSMADVTTARLQTWHGHSLWYLQQRVSHKSTYFTAA